MSEPSQTERVDAYIAAARPFAQPILTHLRAVIHLAHPDLAEAIKWSMPMFIYRDKIVANIAAFTAHAAFGTWRRDAGGKQEPTPDGMGRLGKLTSLADLPADAEIVAMVRAAVAQVDAGGTLAARRAAKPPPVTPDDLAAALAAVPAAAAHFAGFPPGCRREYIDWIEQARTAPTRAKRLAETVAWSAEGKRRNWKYEGC